MPSSCSARATWESESTISRSQRPAQRAHPLRPGRAVRPAAGVVLDRLEHQQLGAVQVADDRHVRRDALRRRVDRRQVVQVQDVDLVGARARERARPRVDVVLEHVVVERGEDAVGRARPVLVGRVQRHLGPHRVLRGRAPRSCRRAARRARRRTRARRRAGPGRASEPDTSRGSQPAAGRLRARLRATWAEPPRGKNCRPISTRASSARRYWERTRGGRAAAPRGAAAGRPAAAGVRLGYFLSFAFLSQLVSLSLRSRHTTVSLPNPQSIRSAAPSLAKIRSLPVPPSMTSLPRAAGEAVVARRRRAAGRARGRR